MEQQLLGEHDLPEIPMEEKLKQPGVATRAMMKLFNYKPNQDLSIPDRPLEYKEVNKGTDK